MKLIAFDGDDTLWKPISSVNLSDRSPTDDTGWPHFTYKRLEDNPLVVQRDDGALFELRPEARDVLEGLRREGILTGVVSYNHDGNVHRVLVAFGIHNLIDYVVAEWHTHKDVMLRRMVREALRDGKRVELSEVLLVDDDPYNIYRGQCEQMGSGFLCFGADVSDLREVALRFSE